MAITIEDQPYSWSVRGQKLMIVASSTNTANDGFQYGVTVTNNTTGQVFDFYISPAIDGRLYFDLQSLIQLRNREAQGNQLGRLDIWPTGDLGVRRGYEKIYRLSEEISPLALEKKGEKFRPYRSVVAWYCWRALG